MLSCLMLSFVEMPQASHRVSPGESQPTKKDQLKSWSFFVITIFEFKNCLPLWYEKDM